MNVLATAFLALASITTTILGLAVVVDTWKTRCGKECPWPQRLKPCFEWFLAGFLIFGDAFIYVLLSGSVYRRTESVGWFGLAVTSLLGFLAGGMLFYWMRDKRVGRR